jgi:hypothetical protein
MNSSKKDYNKLYLLQDKFLSWWVTLGLPFYLTDGTALGRFYLNHRLSEGLDFFINELDVEQRMISFPVEWLENVNWLIKPINTDKFRIILNQIADDFLFGKANSLGENQPPIQNAIPIL